MREKGKRIGLYGRDREMVECYCRDPFATYETVAQAFGLRQQTIKNLMSGILKRSNVGHISYLCYLIGRSDEVNDPGRDSVRLADDA